MDVIVALLVLGAALVAANVLVVKTDRPFTIAELTRSQPGIANPLPAEFLLRARGLGVLAGQLRDAGFTVTSAYRGRALDDKVIDDNLAAGNGNAGFKGPGPHSECRALDVGLSRKFPTAAQLADALRKTTAGGLANQVLAEQTDVHMSFQASDLEQVGAIFVASNPLFDVEGAAAVVQQAVEESVGDVAPDTGTSHFVGEEDTSIGQSIGDVSP